MTHGKSVRSHDRDTERLDRRYLRVRRSGADAPAGPRQGRGCSRGRARGSEIGGFDVETASTSRGIRSASPSRVLPEAQAGRLLLLHFSCHGVKDDAASSTLRRGTPVSPARGERRALDVREQDDGPLAGRPDPAAARLLLLGRVRARPHLQGQRRRRHQGAARRARSGSDHRIVRPSVRVRGRRPRPPTEASSPSVFTSALVRGLQTGEADRDLDGWVSLDDSTRTSMTRSPGDSRPDPEEVGVRDRGRRPRRSAGRTGDHAEPVAGTDPGIDGQSPQLGARVGGPAPTDAAQRRPSGSRPGCRAGARGDGGTRRQRPGEGSRSRGAGWRCGSGASIGGCPARYRTKT